jgi:AraC-like DNA-binding protein
MDRLENGPRMENLYKQLYEMAKGNYFQNIERTDSKDHLEAITALINRIAARSRESIISLGNTKPFYNYAVVTQLLFILDESHQIEEMGNGTPKLLQYGEKYILDPSFKKLLHTDSHKRWAKTASGIVEGPEREKTVRLTYRTKDGLLFPTHCKVIYFPHGRILKGKILVTSIDISIQKKALQESLQKKVYGQLRKKALKSGAIKGSKNRLLPSDLEHLRSAREFIKDHLDAPLPLWDLAKKIGTNEFKLKNGFKEMYGMTVFQYIKEQRLRKAHVLVLYTNMTVGAMARSVGFKQGNHLSREFKKRYGQSPTDLRMTSARSETKNFNSTV